MKRFLVPLLLALAVSAPLCLALTPVPDPLTGGFMAPPAEARPWVYWFWLNGNITREGITADLEAMARVGIGGALIMEVDQGVPLGPVSFMGDDWRALFKHAVDEAARLGLEINMNNDAGWNGSGGPWITPELSMQKVVFSTVEVAGPARFDAVLPQPETVRGHYADIAVLALPAVGDYRIDNILVKACYQTGGAGPAEKKDLPEGMTADPARVTDLTTKMDKDGRLVWDAPEGKWTVIRFGHTSTGVENMPSPESGRGLECDKLSAAGIEAQFAGMMAKLIADCGPQAGKALAATHIDSWENGAQNWTPKMREEFQRLRGYDPLPWLPVMTGRVLGSLERSERFLWDLRQTVSDLIVENYAGRLASLAREHGMRLSIEAYGGPCDDMPYAGVCDEPMGEFWIGGSALTTCKEMASAAHTTGKNITGAEAFTAGDQERWREHPGSIKALGDRAFCAGINRFVFHRYAMQPWLDRAPGMTMGPWGIHFERTQTWWGETPAWNRYLARCQFMLRQGRFAADICHLQPEAAPQGYNGHNPRGYDFDNISARALMERMSVRDGRLVLPDGVEYRVLVLPDVDTMTPALLGKIRELVEAGATVIGPRPRRAPGLTDYPRCDEEVARIAEELWGGAGRVKTGVQPERVLAEMGVAPDFSSRMRLGWIHRKTDEADIYFVANPMPYAVEMPCTFRVAGKTPELWHADTGEMETATVYSRDNEKGTVTLPLFFDPAGSVFVVFRKAVVFEDPVVAVLRDGKRILQASAAPGMNVTRAVYGVADDPARSRDCRGEVQQIIDSGGSEISVAELAKGGDPAFGVVKTLTVEYETGGRTGRVTGRDGGVIHLTGETAAIVITSARYGVLNDPARTRDVREKVQRIVDGGETSFEVPRLAAGDDPAVNVVKSVEIEYTVDGKPHSASGTDQDMLLLAYPAEPHRAADHRNGILEIWEPGRYEMRTALGRVIQKDATGLEPPMEIAGPWELSFQAGRGAPESVTLESLVSLEKHADAGVRHFSGTVTYRTTFDFPAALLRDDRRICLDLGGVGVMARVRLNGTDLGLLWKPPYRVFLGGPLKAGGNTLEIAVTNLWVNRMIGDEHLPPDSERWPEGNLREWPQWLAEGKPSPSGRIAFSTWNLWKKEDPLPPSGLAGPVRLLPVDL